MKYLKHIALILFFALSVADLAAQQYYQFSQYMVDPYTINPAAGGTDNKFHSKLGYRKQWVNFPGAPTSFYFHFTTPLIKKHKPEENRLGFQTLGILAYNDVTGPISRTSALISYGYNLPLSDKVRLEAALSLGAVKFFVNESELTFEQQAESVDAWNEGALDGNAGLWLYGEYFFASISATQLFNQKNKGFRSGEDSRSATQVYHYYLFGGIKCPLGDYYGLRNISQYYIVPSLMIKYAAYGTKPAMDLNLKFQKENDWWLGASYRHMDALIFMAGLDFVKLKNIGLQVSYSYDMTISRVRNYSSGTHEVVIGIKSLKSDKLVCPSNFW